MSTYVKRGKQIAVFTRENSLGKHFHDHDEFWICQEGRAKASIIDHDGVLHEYVLEPGDCLLVGIGCEHWAEPLTDEWKMTWVHGTMAPGAQPPDHYDMETEGYIPSLLLARTPTDRYARQPV